MHMAVGNAGATDLWALPPFAAKGWRWLFALSYVKLNVSG